jgi:hypothetical protein
VGIDGHEVGAAADALAGLGPIEHVFVMQQSAGGLEIIGAKKGRGPKAGDDSLRSFACVYHQASLSPA